MTLKQVNFHHSKKASNPSTEISDGAPAECHTLYIFTMLTVVECHSKAGENQQIFTSNLTTSEDFLIPCKTT